MNSREDKHLHIEILCFKCDKLVENKSYIAKLSLKNRGYGSIFDSSSFAVQLCHGCMKPKYTEWFEEIPIIKSFTEEYKYEEQINALISTFIIENQEYVRNTGGYQINRRDWIDMEYGVLAEEKYEAYGMYSPKTIKAYEERFPTCQHAVNITYNNQSKVSSCVFGSDGHYNQMPGKKVSSECFECTHFEERTIPLMEMTSEKFKQFKAYTIGKANVELYKDIFEN